MKKLVVHIPHSSIHIPDRTGYLVDNKTLESEILQLTDWYTDELFQENKAINVKAEFSRIFCDVERFVDDEFEVMSRFGMGVLYEKLDNGNPLRKVTPDFRQYLIENYYCPHHQNLLEKVQIQLKMNGYCTIVDGHSFPNIPQDRDLNQDMNRPDFNIGTDSYHTPLKLAKKSMSFFLERGFTVQINKPYSGSIVPMEYYQKNSMVKSIMLEVNRKLYLHENTSEKSDQFGEIKKVVNDYLNMVRSFKYQ
jgi:N-formylglutamate deformylase